MGRHLCVLAAAALSAFGCGHESTAPNARIPAVADTLFGAGATLWFATDASGAGTARPAIDAERVYFSRGEFTPSSPTEVVARDRGTGELRWHREFAIARNMVLAGNAVAAASGSLALWERQSGTLLKSYVPLNGDGIQSNAVTDDTQVFVGTYRGAVIAVDASSGAAIWQTALASGNSTSVLGVTLAGDRVAVTLTFYPPRGIYVDSGIVAVLDRASGAVLWRVAVPGSTMGESGAIFDAPVIVGNVIAIVTETHHVHGYDLASGHELWSYDATRGTPNMASNGIAGCDGAVVVSDGNQGLVSLNATTGTVRWQLGDLRIGGFFWIECSYGTVMALSAGILKVFDSASGALLRRVPGSEHANIFVASAGRDANAIYVASARGVGAFLPR